MATYKSKYTGKQVDDSVSFSKDLNSINLNTTITSTTYDSASGIHVEGTGSIAYGTATKDCVVSQEIPLVGADGITIDKAADSEKIEISGKNFVTTKSGSKVVYARDGGNETAIGFASSPAAWNICQFGNGGRLQTNTPTTDLEAANKKYCDDNFVKKNTSTNTAQIYAHVLGEDVMRNFGYEPAFDSLPVYGTNKTLKTSTPQQDTDAANKKYCDDNFVHKTINANAVYSTDSNGVQGYSLVDSDGASGSSIVKRTAYGSVRTQTPSVNEDCANKKYVDDQLAGQKFKTLFGNQSITGSGNIDLFRHVVMFSEGSDKIFVMVPSNADNVISSMGEFQTMVGDDLPFMPASGVVQGQVVTYIDPTSMNAYSTDDTAYPFGGYNVEDVVKPM